MHLADQSPGASMAFPDNLFENVLTAVISGGGTAVSAILAFFRDVKKRVDEIDRRVGSAENRSGLVHSVATLEQTVKDLQRVIEGWSHNPPDWVLRAMGAMGVRRPSFLGDEELGRDLRELDRRVEELEETLEKLMKKIERAVTEEDFYNADKQRAQQISELRTSIADTSGMVKGLQLALGLIKGSRG